MPCRECSGQSSIWDMVVQGWKQPLVMLILDNCGEKISVNFCFLSASGVLFLFFCLLCLFFDKLWCLFLTVVERFSVLQGFFRSSHSGQPPSMGSFHRWSVPCGWSTACWWATSWWVCSRALPCPSDWPCLPGVHVGTAASAGTHTPLSNSWPGSAWALWSSPIRTPQSQPWGGIDSSAFLQIPHHSWGPSRGEISLGCWGFSLRWRVAGIKRATS